jgi:hypothetical protein
LLDAAQYPANDLFDLYLLKLDRLKWETS